LLSNQQNISNSQNIVKESKQEKNISTQQNISNTQNIIKESKQENISPHTQSKPSPDTTGLKHLLKNLFNK